MKVIAIIPARMASSRFPGKPLAKILGIPMIGHVYLRSKLATILREVYIATCDREIEEYCLKSNMNVVMTSDRHERASDRCREAMEKIEQRTASKIDAVVMIQGDEPMVYPKMIEQSIEPLLADKDIQVVNLMAPLKSRQEHEDPNQIKVVVDNQNFALYFSREPIPSPKKNTLSVPMNKQVCIISFRRDFLIKFNELKPTPLEIVESIDMLRILEHGYKVKMVLTDFNTHSVDTIDDLRKVEQLMVGDSLCKQYL